MAAVTGYPGSSKEMKRIDGQLSILDFLSINEKNIGLGEQCEKCDVEWCSIVCFQRRGYIWDRVHRFIKDEKGNKLRKPFEIRECKRIFGDFLEVMP